MIDGLIKNPLKPHSTHRKEFSRDKNAIMLESITLKKKNWITIFIIRDMDNGPWENYFDEFMKDLQFLFQWFRIYDKSERGWIELKFTFTQSMRMQITNGRQMLENSLLNELNTFQNLNSSKLPVTCYTHYTSHSSIHWQKDFLGVLWGGSIFLLKTFFSF